MTGVQTCALPIYIAGQVSLDQAGELVGPGDFEAQLRQTYENLRAALESANAGFENVIKFTTYLTRKEDLGEYRRVRNALYEGFYPNGAYPPNTLLIVSGLVNDDLLIEIEAVAAVCAIVIPALLELDRSAGAVVLELLQEVPGAVPLHQRQAGDGLQGALAPGVGLGGQVEGLVVVAEGDRVPADGRLVQCSDLHVDESLLTGESVPVRKIAAPAASGSEKTRPGGDVLPYVFSGSLAVRGQGTAEVTAIGIRSELGLIGQALRRATGEPPRLRAQMRRLVRLYAIAGAVISLAAVLLHGFLRAGWLEALLAGIAQIGRAHV